ncbi:MAG: cytochrome-c peroxidase [Terricaulis sp.]
MNWGNALAALAAIPLLMGLAAVGELPNLGTFVQSRYDFGLPAWAPAPLEPEGNPTTPAKVELGRRLFYDARLSRDGSMSCASCHRPEFAFTDGRATSPGVTGQHTHRNSMSLANAGFAEGEFSHSLGPFVPLD